MGDSIISGLVSKLNMLPDEVVTLILAMLPISELRGAIPFGIHNNMPLARVLTISILGNLLPVIPLYFLLGRIMRLLDKSRAGRGFSLWLVSRTLKKSGVIQLYEMAGLIIFVGIPLPMTGAWTGTVAAVLLKLRPKYYFIGITGGVLLAAAIVSVLMLLIKIAI